MAILAQHGYGKSTKVDEGLRRDIIQGVILSPQYEKPDNLRNYVMVLRSNFPDKSVAIDPQFYVAILDEPKNEGHLPEYSYYRTGLTRRHLRSPRNIERFVQDTLGYQVQLSVTHVVTPTLCFHSVDDAFCQVALQLAEGAVEYHSTLGGAPPLYVSLVLGEDILKSRASTDDLLNEVSLYDATGFYIIIDYSVSTYDQAYNSEILANLLYLTYSLSELNDFEVVFGYTSLVGLLLHVVGAAATACGWFRTSKQFSLTRFVPTSGGRQPRPRYTSVPLLNSILINPELAGIAQLGLLDQVLTGTSFDGVFRPNPASATWPREAMTLHHWQALRDVSDRILAQGDVRSRLSYMLGLIEAARSLYGDLTKRGVQFELRSGQAQLDEWEAAINVFSERI